MFGDKEYSTAKEANPVREFNNRFVGAGRTEQMIRDRGVYGKDYGPLTGPLAGVPFITYALGGDLQAHGSDFSSGLAHINAGGSHEENPNDGVQMGVDNEGTPNLVEEGETVYDDYVFSNRILADEATKQMFKLPKKKDITFADISKKLEKEISERPNDPISEAGFKAQMQTLEEQQERQKSEMEAERARAAFEALSPEEQTAVMQNAAEQEQMAQQAAQEQAIAEQQAMQQPSPEEAAMMQQQMQAEAMPQEQTIPAEEGYAYGGNLFDIGGLAWIKKNHPEIKNPNAVAKALEKHMQANKSNFYAPDDVGMFGGNSDRTYKWQFERAWSDLMPATTSLSAAEKHFNKWIKAGLSREDAFKLTHSDRIYNQYAGDNRTSAKRDFDAAYTRLVKTPSAKKKITGWKSVDPNDNTVYKTEKEAKMASYAYHQRQKQNPLAKAKEEAAQPAPKAETASVAPQAKAVVASPQKESTQTGKGQVEASAKRTAGTASNKGDIVGRKYDWYRNGNDGYSTPWGFTVGSDGLIDTNTGYTDDYRNLVATLGARDIKDWAVNHPEDSSLQSFLSRNYNGSLDAFIADDKFTDDMWRAGATDGKYGFMHHVSSEIGKDLESQLDNIPVEDIAASLGTTGNVYHALEGDDDYIEGDLDFNVVGDETRREVLPNGDTVIYHDRKNASPAATISEQVLDDSDGNGKKLIPIHRNDKLRYAGLFGPAVGLGMQLVGIGKPDTASLDAAINGTGNVHLAEYQPLGNYLTYRPLDIWYEQNRANALSRATDRNIMNTSGGNRGNAMAGLIANGYNSQLASGNLFRQAQEYNDNQRKQVAEFNRGTDQYNSGQFGATSRFNADAMNRANQYSKQLALHAAAQKMNADASWNRGIYGNVSGLFKGLADLGRENYQYNQMVDLLNAGVIPGVTEEKLVGSGLARYSAEGGKIKKKKNKKRGLTF